MTIVTAIQPTHQGAPQLGNLLGALLPLKHMGEDSQYAHLPLFASVASLHATTVPGYDPTALRAARHTCMSALKALDIQRPKGAELYLFDQADVHTITHMHTLLSHVASLGPLEAMTQFKDKGRGHERAEVGFGLLSYPILMAADILSLGGTLIPVGEDQAQHLQLARMLAQRCNQRFGTTMPLPAPVITTSPRIMDLRDPTRKMSKSYPQGAIFLDQPMDAVHKAFRRATSDSDPIPADSAGLADRPAARNLLTILAGMEHTSLDTVCARHAGQGFSAIKQALSDAYAHHILPIAERMRAYQADTPCTTANHAVHTQVHTHTQALAHAMGV